MVALVDLLDSASGHPGGTLDGPSDSSRPRRCYLAGACLEGSAVSAAALTGARRPAAGVVAGVVPVSVAGIAVSGTPMR